MHHHPTPPTFLYFDLGNVLLKFSHERACRQMAEVAGITSDAVRQIVFESGLQHRYERGFIDCDGFYETFCQLSGTLPARDRLELAGNDIFEFNEPLAEIVRSLSRAGHRLGVLSNTCASHWRYISNGRYDLLGTAFEVYALSFELRTAKPEPEIYVAAAELAGVAPGEIFFTDDRPENIEAAHAAGYQAVLFTDPASLAEELTGRGIPLLP